MEYPWQAAVETLPNKKELQTVDQKIAYANVLALLAIGQELSAANAGETPFTEAAIAVLNRVSGS